MAGGSRPHENRQAFRVAGVVRHRVAGGGRDRRGGRSSREHRHCIRSVRPPDRAAVERGEARDDCGRPVAAWRGHRAPAGNARCGPGDRHSGRPVPPLDRHCLPAGCDARPHRPADAGLRRLSRDLWSRNPAVHDAVSRRRSLQGLPSALHEEGGQRRAEHRVRRELRPRVSHASAGPQRRDADRRGPATRRAAGEAGGTRQRISVALQQLLCTGRARPGHVRAVRNGVAEPGYSDGPGLADRPVRDEHPEGVARVHAAGDAQGVALSPPTERPAWSLVR
jgi:hypothetical protein